MPQGEIKKTLDAVIGIERTLKTTTGHVQDLTKGFSVFSSAAKLFETGTLLWFSKLTGIGRRVSSIMGEVHKASKEAGTDTGTAKLVDNLASLKAQSKSVSEQLDLMKALGLRNKESRKDLIAQLESLKDQHEHTRLMLVADEHRLEAARHLAKVQEINTSLLSIAAVALIGTRRAYAEINEQLVETGINSRLWNKQLYEGQTQQIKLGLSSRQLATIMGTLVSHGLDLRDSFGKHVRLVEQLHIGLGLGVSASGELIAAYVRLGANVQVLADGLATVVEQTALSADEAARLATNLGRAYATLPRQQAARSAEVVKLLGNLEGEIKGLGGVEGELTDLVSRMVTTTEGAGLATMFGVTPEQLASPEGVSLMSRGLTRLVDQSLKGLTGPGRIAQLEMLNQITGLSAATLNQLSQAMGRASQAAVGGLKLQERWETQLSRTGQSVSRMIEALQALGQQALLPVMRVIDLVGGAASWAVRMAAGFAPVRAAVTVLATLAIPYLAKELFKLSATLFLVARHANMAATAMLRAQAFQPTGRMTPGIRGRRKGKAWLTPGAGRRDQRGRFSTAGQETGLRGILKPVLTMLKSPFFALPLAYAVGSAVGDKINSGFTLLGVKIEGLGDKFERVLDKKYQLYGRALDAEKARRSAIEGQLLGRARLAGAAGDVAGLAKLHDYATTVISSLGGSKLEALTTQRRINEAAVMASEQRFAMLQRERRPGEASTSELSGIERAAGELKNLIRLLQDKMADEAKVERERLRQEREREEERRLDRKLHDTPFPARPMGTY